MMTVEDVLEELKEFPKGLKVRVAVETWDDKMNQVYYQMLEIKALKLEDDEVLIEHE